MQLRPDLTVFLPEVAGRFNLYQNGNKKTPNDQHKLTHLLSVFEIKGSTATACLSVKAFAAQLADDLGKLAHWKKTFTAAHPSGRAAGAGYALIALDHGARLKGVVIESLQNQAASLGVELIHVEV
jgi:superoxide dismutase